MAHSRVDLRLETLRERIEIHYKALFDLNPHPMWIYDQETLRFLDVNHAAIETYGYSREEFLAMTIDEIRPDAERQRLRNSLDTGWSNHQIWRHLWRDGTERQVEVDSTDFTMGNRPARLVTATDVTDRSLMEQAVVDREARLRFVVSQIPALLWTTDRHLNITSAAGGALETLQLTPEALAGRNVGDFVALGDESSPVGLGFKAVLGGLEMRFDNVFMERLFQVHLEPLRDGHGEVSGTFGFAVDVTDRRKAEEALRLSEERYRLLFERNLAGVYRSTVDGQLLECNEAFATILGFDSPEEALNTSTEEMYFSSADRETAVSRLSEGGRLINFELRLRKKNGDEVWVLENESLIPPMNGYPATMEGTLIDITDRKKAERVIQHQAYHDALTDLPNRTLFHDRLSLAIAHSRRSGGTLVVMLVDLDHFKLINDTLGHSTGDQMLKLVAIRMQSILRQDDTVARAGGDEFSLLLSDLRSEDDIARLAQKIRRTLAEPFHIGGRELYVTASVGIGLFPGDGEDAEGIIKAVDLALFRAKDLGRDNYQFYTPVAQSRAQERLALENSLRRALEREELEIHYQPQLDLASTEIIGVEALIRWRHPSRGLVYPGEFIHLAEEIGLILPIGEWVLRSACQEALDWINRSQDPLRLAVNLSARQFQQPGLNSMVERILKQTGFPASRLEIEITESVAMQNIDLTIPILQAFRDSGIGVAIDDFGTGYSSLSYLKLLPIDTLKIDQSFIREIATAKRDARIVRAVIEMAHSLGLRVVAEGVETEEQRDTLQGLECDEIQGFLFSRPVPADEIERLLGADAVQLR